MARLKTSWWSKALQNKMILIVLAMMVVIPFIATPIDRQSTGMAALACEGFGNSVAWYALDVAQAAGPFDEKV